MTNWQNLIQRSHEADHKNDGYELVTRPAASLADILALESSLGFQFPSEFHELYQTHDGVGGKGKTGQIDWMFVPLGEIPRLIETARDWFQETHPQTAKRFFPFVDWSSGDSTGYFLSPSGKLLPGLYDFEHEDYEFDESQDEREFLSTVYGSIEELLAPV